MKKEESKIIARWFLEGPNRYNDSSIYRVEVRSHFAPKETAEKILGNACLASNDISFSENLNFSSWELSIKMFTALADMPLTYYEEVPAGKNNVFVIFNADSAEIGKIIVNETLAFMASGYKKNIEKIASRIHETAKIRQPGPLLSRYIAEAEKRNIPHIILNRNPALLQLGYGSKLKKTWSALTSGTSRIGARLTADKHLLNNLLKKIDVPVTLSELVSDVSDLGPLLYKFGPPVVIKPANSTVGKGVSLNIRDLSQAKKAYEKAFKISKKVIMESQVEGYYYRVTFVNGKMIACAKAIPVRVVGNGKKTLRELIEEENKKPYRQTEDSHKSFYKIEITEKLKNIIFFQGLHINSVVTKKQKVFLSFSGADGGEWIEENKLIHPENIVLIRRALKFAELDIAGVDVISSDISVPLNQNGGKILEINAGPDINIHANVGRGKKISVEKAILDYLFPRSQNGRIPLISITGTNGKTTTSKLIAHILDDPSRRTVGLTTSENKYINGALVARGDRSGFLSARSLLINPDIDVAILETCHILGIDKRGLAYDWSDASIITNVTDDHIGTFCTKTEEDLFNIKSVVAKRTKKSGYLILNADNENSVRMANFTQARIAFFSLNHRNPHILSHISKELPVYYMKEKRLWEERSGQKTMLADIRNIPITFRGKAVYNIQNCLGALAAVRLVFGSKISTKEIQGKLAAFGATPLSNPGRFNLIKKNNFQVAIDYAHNPDGYLKTLELAKKIPHRRLVGVIKSAGDRPDDFIKELGRISSQNFDYIFIKEPSQEKIRGRKKGEVSRLLSEGVFSTGFPKKKVEIIYEEEPAVKKALKKSRKGDLLLIFAHNIDQVIEQVTKF